MDRPHVNAAVNRLSSQNSLFHLVIHIITHGLGAHSYRLRGKILIDNYPVVKSTGGSHLIDCETNVCYLVGKIFVDTPSIREISTCTEGCQPREKRLRTISIPQYLLTDHARFEDVLRTHVALKGTRLCTISRCSGLVTTEFSAIGPFVMIEVDSKMPLRTIPMSLRDPMDGEPLGLIGIVDFKPPNARTRSSDDLTPGVGHYTSIVLRPPGIWVRIDDCKDKTEKVSANYNANPHLLFYMKENV